MKKLLILMLFAGLSIRAIDKNYKKEHIRWDSNINEDGRSSKKSSITKQSNLPTAQPWHRRHRKKFIGGAAFVAAAVTAYLYKDNLQERIRNLGMGTWAEKGVDYLGRPVGWLHSGFKNAMGGIGSWYASYFGAKQKTEPTQRTTRKQDELEWEQDTQVRLENLGMEILKLKEKIKSLAGANFYANTSGTGPFDQKIQQKEKELQNIKRQYNETSSALQWRRQKRKDNESMDREINDYWNRRSNK